MGILPFDCEDYLSKQDPLERAKSHAASMYPGADQDAEHARQALLLAVEDNVIRLVRLTDLDTPQAGEQPSPTT
jgi:hypothetical protein